MAIKPTKVAATTVKKAKVPNKRERASAQFGQLDTQGAVAVVWAVSQPQTIEEAIRRIAAAVAAGTSGPIA
jgi:hypothetical protein